MRLLIILLQLFSINIIGQQKILFDNTKSEEAGNADWVIDHSEPEPYPSQDNINSTTSETFWDGAISSWGVEMVKRGYFVNTLAAYQNITYGDSSNSQDLENYDVFVLCEPNNPFNDTEKTALINFVQDGGGLFIISDHHNADRDGDGWDAYEALNDLMENNSVETNPFGMYFTNEDFINDYPNNNMINDAYDPILHGDAGSVYGMEFHGSASMTIYPDMNPTVKAIVFRSGYPTYNDDNVMVAYSEYGEGRVVGLVDSSPADDGTGNSSDNLYYGWDELDNGKLITNATLWLLNTETTSTNSLSENNHFSLYPNPSDGVFYVQNNSLQHIDLEIFDINGKLIKKLNLINNKTEINLQYLKKGLYILKLISDKMVIMDKIIIN